MYIKIDEAVLGSFMHHLTHVRNLVAHHSRLWNRRMTFTMSIPRHPAEMVGWFNRNADRKIYNTLIPNTKTQALSGWDKCRRGGRCAN
ncbi:MAG: Abi family protein [Nitrospirae bacterium]|nr:Abi family protein [Nitrospirota bacterium]